MAERQCRPCEPRPAKGDVGDRELSHLGARVGVLSVLHTWGSALAHRPHVHMIVPGGGISLDGRSWVSCFRRYKVMTLATSEFIRRFLIHVLPSGFHRIRYYGLLATTVLWRTVRRRLRPSARKLDQGLYLFFVLGLNGPA